MNVIIDTNVLVRFLIADDEIQYNAVIKLFNEASSILIPTIVLCETIWVLRGYKIERKKKIEYVRFIKDSDKVVLSDDEVEAGLELLKSGGDFVDGVAAYAGQKLSRSKNSVFASFDQKAVKLLTKNGHFAFIP